MQITLKEILQKRLAIFVVLLLATVVAKADENSFGILKGYITSKGDPVAGAVARIKNTNKTAQSDNNGYFEIDELSKGKYKVEISLTGYKTSSSSVIIKEGEVTEFKLAIKSADNKLDEVFITGTHNRYKKDNVSNSLRLNTPLKEIPQNIQIVSANVLSDQQVISMSDGVLRNVSGVTQLEHWGDMYTRINMRGSRIAAFRNGVNAVNSSWGPLTEDMSFVDHVEFVKGPAGFMLANGDPSGLYNVVTKKPTGKDFNGAATLTLGSFDLYRTTLDLDGKFDKAGKLAYRLNLMGQTKNSFRSNEFNDRYSIAPVLSYQLDDKTKLTVEYALQHAKMSNVGSYYLFSTKGYEKLPHDVTLVTPAIEPTIIDDHSVFVNLQHEINDNWKITAQTAFFNYKQQGTSMWPGAVNPDGTIIRNLTIWDAVSTIKSGQAYVNGNVQTGKVRHRFLGGIDITTKDYYADWSQGHLLDSPGVAFDTYNPTYTTPVNGYPEFDRSKSIKQRAIMAGGTIQQQYSGLYLQDELGFFNNKLRVTLAGRYSYVEQSAYGAKPETAYRITPRFGVSYSIDNNTSVYGLYDQAFIPQAGIMRNRGTVKPVTGDNVEVGVKKDWFDNKWNTTLSLYRIIKNNELTADPTNAAGEAYSVVLGEKVAQGVELDIKGEIVKGLNVVANYAYTDSKVTKVSQGLTAIKVGDRIPGFAQHNIKTWFSYKFTSGPIKGVGVSAGFTYMMDRDTWSWGQAGLDNLPDYFRLDGGLFWEQNKMRATLNVYNILDEYLYSGSYYGYGKYYYWQAEAPLNARFSLSYKF